MPGTETCLKVSGYIRVDIKGGDHFEKISNAGEETYNNLARFQLRVDARSETELGTLRSYAAINFNYAASGEAGTYDNEDGGGIEHAYLELGGFRIGKTDSLFSTFTDYASGVMTDGVVGYGPFATLQIAYTYTGDNGFSAAVALEQGDEDESDNLSGITEDYAPYVVGGVSLTQGWGKVGVVAGYDSWQEEVAVKGRLDVNITETASVFVMAAWDSGGDDHDVQNDIGANWYAPWHGDWAVWGGAKIKLNEKATFNAEVGYSEMKDLSVVANVAYQLVPNFTITPEVVYFAPGNLEDHRGAVALHGEEDHWGARIRFQRNF